MFKRTYKSPVKTHAYNGKLTCDTLLPKENSITKVGGEMGWSNVNGVDYYGAPFKTQTDEGSTWRIELSPAKPAAGDLFLNVMQVSDADKNDYLPVELIESDSFCGAKIQDRAVLFSKTGERVSGGISFNVPGSGDIEYTVCDVGAGSYSVTAGGKKLTASVTEEGGVLSFTAPAGAVTAEKTEDEAKAETNPVSKSVEADNAPHIRIDNAYVWFDDRVQHISDTVMVSTDDLVKRLGVKAKSSDSGVTLTSNKNSVSFTEGSAQAVTNDGTVTMSAAAQSVDGKLFVPIRTAVEALGGSVDWDGCANTVYINSPPADLSLPAGYARIVAAKHDGGEIDKSNTVENIFDEDASTIWSTNGTDRYLTLELEKSCTVEGVDIMFNPNQGRDAKFTIAVSEDGKKFTDIYSDHGDGAVEGGAWEEFRFSPQSNIKFVRYHGNGSNISRWNAVKEIRVKVQ